tara:strand:+ start:99 stop:770 length:672 start_codon:yes stop_codon:yes gene_type:complete
MPLDFKTTTHDGQLVTGAFEATWYWHTPSFFCPEQIQRVTELCTEEPLVSGTVRSKGEISDIRKSLVSRYDHEELYALVRNPMHEVNTLAGWDYDITAIEPIQYTVYNGANDHYSWHTDTLDNDHLTSKGPDNIQNGTVRKISCSIQLDSPSDYEGGDLEFVTGHTGTVSKDGKLQTSNLTMPQFKEKGSATFFPSFTYHQIKPVTKGLRRSLVIWFRGPKWR